jgi:hypothetical protein
MNDKTYTPKCHQQSLTEIIPGMEGGVIKEVGILVKQALDASTNSNDDKHKQLLLQAVQTIEDHMNTKPEAKKRLKKGQSPLEIQQAKTISMMQEAATRQAEEILIITQKMAIMKEQAQQNPKKRDEDWEKKAIIHPPPPFTGSDAP